MGNSVLRMQAREQVRALACNPCHKDVFAFFDRTTSCQESHGWDAVR
jgi:hypothetical protein